MKCKKCLSLTKNLSKHILRHNYFLIVLIIFMVLCSCEKSPTENYYINNYYLSDSLTNPNVQPAVIFTNPKDGDIGPFKDYDRYENLPNPKFTIQFNKLINIPDLPSDAILLKVGETVIPIDLYNFHEDEDDYSPIFFQNILMFRAPYHIYMANTTYTVTIDTTLEDVHGYRLPEPYTFSFMPEPYFRVYWGYPNVDNISPIHLGDITMNFNSVLNADIFNKISISPEIRGAWRFEIRYFNPSYIAYWVSDTIMHETTYIVSVSEDAQDANGLTIHEPYQFSFTTSPFEVNCRGWSGHYHNGFMVYNDIRFGFNGIVDTSSVKPSMNITPTIPYNISFIATYGVENTGIKIMFDEDQMEESTTYEIAIDTTVHSIKGAHLKEPFSYSFTTGSRDDG